MHIGNRSNGAKATTGKKEGVRWFTGLVVVSWVLGSVWAAHFILEDTEKSVRGSEALSQIPIPTSGTTKTASANPLPPEVRQRVQPPVRPKAPLEPEMVVIPGGSFRMGCVSGLDCQEEELPGHTVRIERFKLSKYEVTFEEYDRFTEATGRERAKDEGWGRGRRPVIHVSWEDAVAYTRWLSEQTEEKYRLPSEAEWEYAARGGTETKYHFGNDESRLCNYANHWDSSIGNDEPFYESRNRSCSDGVGKKTAIVGSYRANTYGLHDMHGNVSEWVQDCWNGSYQGAPADGSPWENGNCSVRILRGGCMVDFPRFLRSAYRIRYFADDRSQFGFGFRVGRTITP